MSLWSRTSVVVALLAAVVLVASNGQPADAAPPKVSVLAPVGARCTPAKNRCIKVQTAKIRCARRICVIPLHVRSSAAALVRVKVGAKVTTLRAKKGTTWMVVRVPASAKRVSVRLVAPPRKQSPQPARASTDIRAVDFMNRDYVIECAGGMTRIAVRRGYWEITSPDGVPDYFSSRIPTVSVTYGDVTGDGADEALVFTACGTGGPYDIPNVLVFATTPTGVQQLGGRIIGEKPSGGAGLLSTRLYIRDAGDPAGSYTWTDTSQWRWIGSGWLLAQKDRAYTPFSQDDLDLPR